MIRTEPSCCSGFLTMAMACFLGFACSPEAPAKSPEPPAPSSQQAKPPQSALYSALKAIQPAGSPIDALPSNLRQRLDDLLAHLSPEQKTALLSDQDPTLVVHPLLHLAAGGRSLKAYQTIISTTVVSDELVQLRFPSREFEDLIDVSNEVVRRAALNLLRERAADFVAGRALVPERLEQVAQAAATLKRRDIEVLALQELTLLEAKPERNAALAVVHAERLELQPAEKLLEAAIAQGGEDNYRWASNAVAEARVVTASRNASTPEGRVAVARAYIALGQEELAVNTLQATPEFVGKNLAYTTALIRAQLGGTACPNVLRGNSFLCRAAWARAQKRGVFAPLPAAWKTGQGRDPASIEAYLGLSFVVPMMYRMDESGAEAGPEVFRDHLNELEKAAMQASQTLPYLKGVAGFAAALSSAFASAAEASQGPRAVIPEEVRQSLLARADGLNQELGHDFWGQAGILGILALVSQDESVDAQLRALQPNVLPPFQVAFGTLTLWTALADKDSERMKGLRGLLTEITRGLNVSGLARSRWLVLWAESEAHLLPGEKSYTALLTMSKKLLESQGVPLGLRLRAALDTAGIQARQGKFGEAAEALAAVATEVPKSAVSSRDEQELLIAAQAYVLILRALATQGEERFDYTKKLEALLLDVNKKAAAAPTLQMWLALWRGQLEAETRKESCKGNKVCEKRAEQARGISKQHLEQAVGARTAQLLTNGVVPIGGVELEFRYKNDGRIAPHIKIDPRFPLVHVPSLEN